MSELHLIKKIRTDIGDLQIDYASLANLPDLSVYAANESVKSLSSKVEQISTEVADITPESIGALSVNNIANNVATSEEGYALDARQGMVLKTSIDDLVDRIDIVEKDIETCETNVGANTKAIGANTKAIAANTSAIESKISMETVTVTLPPESWSDNEQTVVAPGVADDNVIIVTPSPSSYVNYNKHEVRCSGQLTDKLIFSCTFIPDGPINANILILS